MTIPSPDDAAKNPLPWILGIIAVIFFLFLVFGGSDGQSDCGGQQFTAEYC